MLLSFYIEVVLTDDYHEDIANFFEVGSPYRHRPTTVYSPPKLIKKSKVKPNTLAIARNESHEKFT